MPDETDTKYTLPMRPDRPMTAAEEQHYVKNNYGTCRKEPCECRATGEWKGTECPFWQPTTATTLAAVAGEIKREAA